MLKRVLKQGISSALGVAGLKLAEHKFGGDLYLDIKYRLPKERISTAFDVGANEGQTAVELLREYPSAAIHCFEPNPECCRKIKSVDEKLNVHQIGLSSKPGTASLDTSGGGSDRFRLGDGDGIRVETIDGFCAANGIRQIDFLKIDTEGHDLEVMRGAGGLFQEQRIKIVQAEVSMSADNSFHVVFEDVHRHMQELGYRLFGIYEQVHEWPTRSPNLRRSNVAYISPDVITRNGY